ncbi:MAG: hypothetical protein GY862_01305 [Gammaproteobacteria bacterium]|nr:hypothetical protein [Gammaproteobacteria bacterium]
MSHELTNTTEVLDAFHLAYKAEEFIDLDNVPPVKAADWFKEEIKFSLANRGKDDKEAFASEFIVVPFLKEIWKKHPKLNLFSHVQINADDLSVIPDYLITAKHPSGYKTVHKPLLLTVEVKNEQFEEGWFQALLQSVACRKVNGAVQHPLISIVTTGDSWEFGKLEKDTFFRHPLPYSVQNMDRLLGILDALFLECEAASGLTSDIS